MSILPKYYTLRMPLDWYSPYYANPRDYLAQIGDRDYLHVPPLLRHDFGVYLGPVLL